MIKDKNPNYVFYSTLKTNDLIVKKVLCHIYLPVKIVEPIEIRLFLNKQQYKIFTENHFWAFSIEGKIRGYKNRIEDYILCNRAFSADFLETSLSPEYYISVACQTFDLTVESYHHFPKTEKVFITFDITHNVLLGQTTNQKRTEDRGWGTKNISYWEFYPDEETKFTFEHDEGNYKNQDGDEVTFNKFIAKVEIENETNNNPKILQTLEKLDKILLLSSFAARHLTVCLKWEAFDGKKDVKKYLRDRAIPNEFERNKVGINPVIGFSQMKEFLKTGYLAFCNYSDIDALRRAMYFLILSERETIDGGFMILYSALEMLVLHFRRKEDLELIIPTNKFEKYIRKSVKNVIDESELSDLNDEKKRMMKDKLSELNRVSFATAFNRFCEFYSVNLEDLWSVLDSKGGISLSQIRNKLVHGEHFEDNHYGAILCAKQHLKWTIERMILAILKWSVDKSEISSVKLQKMFAYQTWIEERKILSK